MSFRAERDTSLLPGIYALHLADLVTRFGVTATKLLQGSGFSESELSQPQCWISVTTMEQLIARARALTGEPALGIYFGLQMRISWHGYVGLAAMTAQNVRQALELAARFVPTLTDALTFSLDFDGPVASLYISEQTDFGTARDAVILALMVGIWQLAATLTGQQIHGTAELVIPEPSYIHRVKKLLPGPVRFGQLENRLLFDAEVLDLPMVAADPAALQMIREQCERELEAQNLSGLFRERVRALALRSHGGARSLEEAADELHISSRTLKRKLAALFCTYSELLDEERKRRALMFLRTTSLSLEKIADRLGYSDTANFIRAFRRWTGCTPGAVRRSSFQEPQSPGHGENSE